MPPFTEFHAFPAVFFAGFVLFMVLMPMMALASFMIFRRSGGMDARGDMHWMPLGGPFAMMRQWQQPEPASQTTGNSAFDAYRAETLARLEEEARAFAAYRDRLNAARDKAEFERFLDEMKRWRNA